MTNILVKHYINVLKKQIETQKNQKIEETVEAILENLYYLSKNEKDATTEEEIRWIPIQIKRMLLYILFEGKAIIETKLNSMKENEFAEVQTQILYENQVIAQHSKRICYDDVSPFSGFSPAKRNVLMVEQAKGSCETRALYKAGIAMEFTGDVIDVIPGNNQQLPTTPLVQDHDSIINNMNKILEQADKEDSLSPTTEQELTVLFGASEGSPLSSVSDAYKIYMLAYIDEGVEQVDESYRASIEASLSAALDTPDFSKKYNTYCKMARKAKSA